MPPDEAFALLANDTRVATIETLWAAWGEGPVPFSELRRRVGVRDAGQFHYHLRKLQAHFVTKVETDEAGGGEVPDGYELTPAGFKTAQSVIAGTGLGRTDRRAETLEDACPRCEHAVELTYESGVVRIYCRNCPGFWHGEDEFGPMGRGYLGGWEFPPAGLHDRSPEGILDASIAYMITRTESLLSGVCPDCGGTATGTVGVCSDHDPDGGVCAACGRQFLGVLNWRCGVCKLAFGAPSWAAAILHPEVRSLLAAAGVDYRDDPWRTVHLGYEHGWTERVVDGDPLRLQIDVTVGEEVRVLTLDEAGRVVAVRDR